MAANDNTLVLNTKSAKTSINSNSAYVELDDAEDITRTYYQQHYYTKYDNFAKTIVISSILFLLSWIGWIIYNINHYGINTAYCQEPQQSCNYNDYKTPSCCNITGIKNTCYNPVTTNNQCSTPSKTISTFIAQILLLLVIIFCIILLYHALRKGIDITTRDAMHTPIQRKQTFFMQIMEYVKSARINCRKYAYSKKETPQKTSVEFLWNSLTILSVLKLLHDLPIILLNVLSGDKTLHAVGLAMISADISNIVQYLWGNYSPCCNPFRGKCCGDECCCDCCCAVITCRCFCNHFPEQHKPYVLAIGNIVNFSNYLALAAGTAQISGVGFIQSTTEYHVWLVCLNFVLGVVCIVKTLQVYWNYYYLLCFYWSRNAVNKYESLKIHELLNRLLIGGYVFMIKVENDDEFVTIDNDVVIADKVNIVWDCWSCLWIFHSLGICCGIMFLFWSWTVQLNQDFNINKQFDPFN